MTELTVPFNDRLSGPYTASGGQTVFAYDFPVFAGADLAVIRRRSDVETQLVLTTDYTVTGAGEQAGGTVVLVVGATAGDIVSIHGARAVARPGDFQPPPNGPSSTDFNAELDALQMQLQELRTRVARAARLKDTDADDDMRFPLKTERQGGGLGTLAGYDTAGKPRTFPVTAVDGSVSAANWLAGSGAPASNTGATGDMYLNTANGDVYGPKTAGGWGGVVLNIVSTGTLFDFPEIAEPASPAANVGRVYAADEGGVTVLRYKDAAGVVRTLPLLDRVNAWTAVATWAAAQTWNALGTFAGTTEFYTALIAKLTHDGANPGPFLPLYRVSASPAASDRLGGIPFKGKDSGGNDTDYAGIEARIIDPTDASEDGELVLQAIIAGSGVDVAKVGNGLQVGAPTGGYKGVGTLNLTEIYKNGVPSWNTVVKATDETIQSDTTLDADAALVFPMLANTKYAVRGFVLFDTGATGDFKWRHAGPAAPTLVRIHRRGIIGAGTADATILVDLAYSAADVALAGAAGAGMVMFEGIIHNGANAGNFQFQWAQNASEAVDTTVRAGSYLEWRAL